MRIKPSDNLVEQPLWPPSGHWPKLLPECDPLRTGDLERLLARLASRLNISMIRFLSKHEMKHIAVPYMVDLILLHFAEYPLGESYSEKRKDRAVIVHLALRRPGMGVAQVGVEHFPVRVFNQQEHGVQGTVVPYGDRYLDPVCCNGFEEMLRHYSTSILPEGAPKDRPGGIVLTANGGTRSDAEDVLGLTRPVDRLRGSMASVEAAECTNRTTLDRDNPCFFATMVNDIPEMRSRTNAA
jgi:hypothetical protein